VTFEEIKSKAEADLAASKRSDKPQILIGAATCGRAAGALAVLEAINSELAKRSIEAEITQVGCIGLCYAEVLVDIIKPNYSRISYGNVTPEVIPQLIDDYILHNNPRPDLALGIIGEGSIDGIPKFFELPMLKSQVRIAMRNCGLIDPEDLSQYIANGGYAGLSKALKMTPEVVIEEVKKSGLRGRGGAGFPTFVDRTLLEGDPHMVLEGMLIGAYAIGATKGYIYIRVEYPLATERLKIVLKQARELGLLGDNILGSGFSFDIEIRRGAGAFICGEETALINSLEGKRGIPRIRPPFPAQEGLWGKPTNVNNVETLASVPAIIEKGGDWYAGIGMDKSKGTKLFSLSGNITRTGVAEVPFGISLRELIEEVGGGVPDGRKLKALQPGGAMLGLIPAGLIDRPVDFEGLMEIGSGVGSGGLAVIDDSACMVDIACLLLRFAYDECCGKCVVGRLGTKQMLDILQDITRGNGRPQDPELLIQLGEAMIKGSLCPLCGGAPCPVISTLKHFGDEYEAHIKQHRCPTGICPELSKAS